MEWEEIKDKEALLRTPGETELSWDIDGVTARLKRAEQDGI